MLWYNICSGIEYPRMNFVIPHFIVYHCISINPRGISNALR